MANLTTLKLGTTTYTIKDPTYTASDVLTKIKSVGGSGSGLSADLLDGHHASVSNNKPYGTIPVISSSGYINIGKSVEFHFDNTTGSDYSTQVNCTGNYSNILSLPSTTGTLALISDNVSSASKLQTSRTINGTSFNGTANITTANWGTSRNIKIGHTSKSVNGSSNVSWSLNEIGCPQVIDLASYEVSGDVLPTINAVFKYGSNLTHHRTIYLTTDEIPGFENGNFAHVFCAEHDVDYDSEIRGHIYIVYTQSGQYITTFVKDDGGHVPIQILQAFGEADATTSYTGLMSYIDKRKLDSINTSLYMPKSGGTFTGKIQFGNANNYIYYNSAYLSLQTNLNEICISGTNDTSLSINYRKAHNGHAPAKFIWHKGASGTYADHEVGQITAHGNVNAPAYYQTSDIRYKNIIDNIEVKIEDIASLPIFNFNWKDSDNNQYCGTSAQEVKKILPNAVQGDDKLSLDYGVLATISSVTCAKELVEIKKQLNELKQLILDKNGK